MKPGVHPRTLRSNDQDPALLVGHPSARETSQDGQYPLYVNIKIWGTRQNNRPAAGNQLIAWNTIDLVSFRYGYLFESLQEQQRSIFYHFRCGFRNGYHFGKLKGEVEVVFWSFSLRVGLSPQNEFSFFFFQAQQSSRTPSLWAYQSSLIP